MQPASANASVWTGDGPDWLSPSIVIELFGLFDDEANLSPSFHARSTTVGGFDSTEEILPIHVFFENHYALRHQNAPYLLVCAQERAARDVRARRLMHRMCLVVLAL